MTTIHDIDFLKVSPDSFSPGQLKMMKLIYEGYSNKAIADMLGVTLGSINLKIFRTLNKISKTGNFDGMNTRIIIYKFYEENVLKYG